MEVISGNNSKSNGKCQDFGRCGSLRCLLAHTSTTDTRKTRASSYYAMSLLNPIGDPDDAYRSSEDSDFDAEVSALSGEDSASSDDEGQKPTARTKKRRVDVDGDLEMGSGDEGVIAQGRKKRRKKGKGKGKKSGAQEEAVEGDDDEEEAGRIRVRLRSGRGG